MRAAAASLSFLLCTALLLCSEPGAQAQPTGFDAATPAPSQVDPLIQHVGGRQTTDLGGGWPAIIDPYENGYYNYRYEPTPAGYFVNRQPQDPDDLIEYDFAASEPLEVPGDWNSQRPELFLYEGTVWYGKTFDYALPEERRLFVHVGAANYEARAYLNGAPLGVHVGGFTPFNLEVTDRVRATGNFLAFKVDNARRRDGVPTVNTDWWNYGGLTRPVRLVEVPATFVRDYALHLDPAAPDILAGWVQLDGADARQTVTVRIPDAEFAHTVETDADGYAAFRVAAPDLRRWSPEDPHRYAVVVEAETDRVADTMGFRTLTTRGADLLLNGVPVFLRGISIHEEALGGGRAYTRAQARTLLGWAKDLGCNFVRLAHYPHNEAMVREAEAMGLLVWAEIPVYWTILWGHAEVYALARQQLREMVARDRNRAAVALWSVANETPRSEARLAFLTGLIDEARRLDPTRLITAATEVTFEGRTLVLDDPLGDHLDVIGVNEYLGWYGDTPVAEIAAFRIQSTFDKPLVVSEFGAGAKYGLRGDAGTIWTEDYQAALYRQQIALLREVDVLRGMSPWILMDFRSPRRPLPGIQDFWNRKGLLSERGQRKLAFGVLQAFYGALARQDAGDNSRQGSSATR
ncbi:MAG: glycoside hydrolase family 2 TIM barrel-domain containing protein [Bacteroidota bacterium]